MRSWGLWSPESEPPQETCIYCAVSDLDGRLHPTDLTTRVRATLSCTIQSLTRCSLGRQKPRHKLTKASKATGELWKGFRHSWIQASRSGLGGQPGVSSRRHRPRGKGGFQKPSTACSQLDKPIRSLFLFCLLELSGVGATKGLTGSNTHH